MTLRIYHSDLFYRTEMIRIIFKCYFYIMLLLRVASYRTQCSFFLMCLFIWLHWVLVAALGVFDLHCSMQDV